MTGQSGPASRESWPHLPRSLLTANKKTKLKENRHNTYRTINRGVMRDDRKPGTMVQSSTRYPSRKEREMNKNVKQEARINSRLGRHVEIPLYVCLLNCCLQNTLRVRPHSFAECIRRYRWYSYNSSTSCNTRIRVIDLDVGRW